MRRTLLTEFMMCAPYQPATNYWRAVEVEEVISYGLPQGSGLDLGCGDGHLTSIVLAHIGSRKIIGLDADPQETIIAARRNLYQRVVTSMADHMPFADGEFDFVFSNSVLEHIPNITATLSEVARVLRTGGRLIFTVPGSNFHQCLKGPRSQDRRHQYLREIDARCFHLRYWSADQWADNLRRSGLHIVHHHEYLSLPQVRRWESVARNSSGVLYKLCGRKQQPIDIQRRMRVRNARVCLPRFLASFSAHILDVGSPTGNSLFGCLLIEAIKA